METIDQYYDVHYFNDFQKEIGEFGGIASKFIFQEYISEKDAVLDFGCGGGFLLKNIKCKKKVGVEINEVARHHCISLGIECHAHLEEIDDESIDVIISNHCLEHTPSPVSLVADLFQKLRAGGTIVIVVPLDNYNYRWKQHDVNNHLYSLSPMNLGNILQAAGFNKITAEPLFHKWFPGYKTVYKLFGAAIFHSLCFVYGRLNKKYVQIKGVGIK